MKKATDPECANCGEQSAANKRCGRCFSIYYCQSTCQKQDWKLHKPKCIAPKDRVPGEATEKNSEPECNVCLDIIVPAKCAVFPCCGNQLCFACVDSLRRCNQGCPYCRVPLPPATLYMEVMQDYLRLRTELYGNQYLLNDDNPEIWFQMSSDLKQKFKVVYEKGVAAATLGQPSMCSFLAGEMYYRHFDGDPELWARKAVAYNDVEGYVILCKLAKRRAAYDEAEAFIKTALAADPNPSKYFELGDVLLRKYSNRPHCAEDAALVLETEHVLLQSLEGSAIDYLSYNALFTLMSGQKRWSEALRYAKKSIALHDNAPARVGLEYATAVMLITTNPVACRQRLERMYTWQPDNISSVDLLYADALMLTGSKQECLELLEKSVSLVPSTMQREIRFRIDSFKNMPAEMIPVLIKAKYDASFATQLTSTILAGPHKETFERAMSEGMESYDDVVNAVLRN